MDWCVTSVARSWWVEKKFLCAAERLTKEAEERGGQASCQCVCLGQVLNGQEDWKKDSSSISSALGSSFLTKRGRRLSIFSKVTDNLLLKLWNGHLPSNLPLSGSSIWKSNHKIYLCVPGFISFKVCAKPELSPLSNLLWLPFLYSFPKSLGKSAYSSFGGIWLSQQNFNLCSSSKLRYLDTLSSFCLEFPFWMKSWKLKADICTWEHQIP